MTGAALVAVVVAVFTVGALELPAAQATGSVGGFVQVVTRSSGRLASSGAYPGRTVGMAPTRDSCAWHERVGEVRLAATVVAGRSAQPVFSLPLSDAP